MISVLIPWRSSDPDRVRAWEYNRPLWRRLPVQLCVADDGRTEGPFSVSRAINRARKQATADMLVLYGADHIPPDLPRLAWICDRLIHHPWTVVYENTLVINRWGTSRVLQGMPPEVASRLRAHRIPMCMGVIAIRAEVWDDVGGQDERFEGWGAEDVALLTVLRALYPDGRSDGYGDAWALWHEYGHNMAPELTAANVARCTAYEQAAAAGRMREHLREVRNG